MARIDVIDISHWNTVASWDKIKAAGVKGVICKASQGTRYGDDHYVDSRAHAKMLGLLHGAYHFCTNADPVAQVDWFLKHAQPDDSTLLALDWEHNPDGPDLSLAQAKVFLTTLMARSGRQPKDIWIYGGNVLKEQIRTPEDCQFFGQFRLWLCQYAATPRLPKAWPAYGLWQYSETGALDGVSGHVDLNVYEGADLAADWAPGARHNRSSPEVADEPLPALGTSARGPAAPLVIPAADPPADEAKPGLWDKLVTSNAAKVNELADQGSRLADSIRTFKSWFWKGATVTVGGGGAASQLMDTTKGTGGAISQMVAAHPFLFAFGCAGLVAVLAYAVVKFAIERGLISAHADGRYKPRGA